MHRIRGAFFAVALLATLVAAGCGRKEAVGTAADRLAAAWNDYSFGEFNRAQAGFDAVVREQPAGSAERLEALYGLATTYSLRRPGEDPARAAAVYRDIIREAPSHSLSAWSLLALARMQHLVPVGQEPDYPAVRRAYQEVIDRFPTHLAGQEAFIYQQATLLLDADNAGEARQALGELQRFAEAPGNARFVSPAYSLMAVAHRALRDPEAEVACLIKALETAEIDATNPRQEFSGTYWSIAATAEFEAGDFATARRFYKRLIEEYPVDQRVHGARQALKRMDDVEAALAAGGAAAGAPGGVAP